MLLSTREREILANYAEDLWWRYILSLDVDFLNAAEQDLEDVHLESLAELFDWILCPFQDYGFFAMVPESQLSQINEVNDLIAEKHWTLNLTPVKRHHYRINERFKRQEGVPKSFISTHSDVKKAYRKMDKAEDYLENMRRKRVNKSEIDRILDKINALGIESLTAVERLIIRGFN